MGCPSCTRIVSSEALTRIDEGWGCGVAVVGTDRPDLPAPNACWALLRWLMLIAVIGGIFGMHVLTGSEMTSEHGPLPKVGHSALAGTAAMQQPAEESLPAAAGSTQGSDGAAVAATTSGSGQGMSHDAMGACILFLVVGGAAAVAALLATRLKSRSGQTAATMASAVAGAMRRGPPGRCRPRIALCVYRV